jgi:hypothetical protein
VIAEDRSVIGGSTADALGVEGDAWTFRGLTNEPLAHSPTD